MWSLVTSRTLTSKSSFELMTKRFVVCPRCTVRAHTESGPGTHAQLSHRPQVSALALSRSGLLIASGQLGSSRSPERVAPVVVWDYERRRQVFNLFGISQVRHHTKPQQWQSVCTNLTHCCTGCDGARVCTRRPVPCCCGQGQHGVRVGHAGMALKQGAKYTPSRPAHATHAPSTTTSTTPQTGEQLVGKKFDRPVTFISWAPVLDSGRRPVYRLNFGTNNVTTHAHAHA